jgi:hypothetical protein
MWNRSAVTLTLALCLGGVVAAQSPTAVWNDANVTASSTAPVAPLPPADTASTVQGQALIPDRGSLVDSSPTRYWGSVDYLLSWMKSAPLPPLVTTSPAGTARSVAGVIGQPNTTTLFGNNDAAGEFRSGLRLDLGAWIDREHTLGVDAGFFMIASQANLFFANSPDGNTILARPFVDATSGTPISQLIAFPGVSSGSVTGAYRSDNFVGANLDLEEVVLACDGFRVTSLLGYRFLQFNDRLAIDTNETALPGGVVAAGTTIVVSDRFSASDVFHGADFGVRGEYGNERWSVGLLARLAVGSVHRSIGITGATTTTVPGSAPVTSSGGFLALSSNNGVFSLSDWVVAPEFGLNVGWNINSNVTLRLGYSVLVFTDIARANDQVNLSINPALFPPAVAGATPNSPAFHLQKTDLWLQSLSLGMEYRF